MNVADKIHKLMDPSAVFATFQPQTGSSPAAIYRPHSPQYNGGPNGANAGAGSERSRMLHQRNTGNGTGPGSGGLPQVRKNLLFLVLEWFLNHF